MLDRGSDAVGHWQSNRTLGIILHAACNAWGNALITFLRSTPPHVTRKVVQNTRPSFRFRGGSGHETTFNTARRKGGLVNIEQHFCTSVGFRRYNLIGWCVTCTRLLYRKPLSFTHHTFTDLLSTPPIYWSPARDFKGLAFRGIHSNS